MPIISYGVRAYVDVPYLLLVLCAVLLETRRRRAGAPVLALLALAGLLRPEAWVFSGLYWLYLLFSQDTSAYAGARRGPGAGASALNRGDAATKSPASSSHPFGNRPDSG